MYYSARIFGNKHFGCCQPPHQDVPRLRCNPYVTTRFNWCMTEYLLSVCYYYRCNCLVHRCYCNKIRQVDIKMNQYPSTVNLSSVRYLHSTSASLDRWQTTQLALTPTVPLTRSVVSLTESNVAITWANSMSAALGNMTSPPVGASGIPPGGKIVSEESGSPPGCKVVPGDCWIPSVDRMTPKGRPVCVVTDWSGLAPSASWFTTVPWRTPGPSLGTVAVMSGDGTSSVLPGGWLVSVPISTIIKSHFALIYNFV